MKNLTLYYFPLLFWVFLINPIDFYSHKPFNTKCRTDGPERIDESIVLPNPPADSICDLVQVNARKIRAANECCYEIDITNNYGDNYFQGIQIDLAPPADISLIHIVNSSWQIVQKSAQVAWVVPAITKNIPMGDSQLFTICDTTSSDYIVTTSWLVPSGGDIPDKVCPEELPIVTCNAFTCDLVQVNTTEISNGTNECCYEIDITNNYSGNYFQGIQIDLAPPATTSLITPNPGWIIVLQSPPSQVAWVVPNFNSGFIPMGNSQPFEICDTTSSDYTIQINWLVSSFAIPDAVCPVLLPLEHCDSFTCDLVNVNATEILNGTNDCCYEIDITNNYSGNYFQGIQIDLTPPANTSWITPLGGWYIDPGHTTSSTAWVKPPGYTIPTGSSQLFTICDTTSSDYNITVSWITPGDLPDIVCPVELLLEHCDLPNCYELVEDSIDCVNNTYCFKIKNTSNPGFGLYSVSLYDVAGGSGSVLPTGFINIPNAPLVSGQISDWICVTYAGVNTGDTVCYKLVAYNTSQGTPPTECCTDSLENCFTIPDCCCDEAYNLVENGSFSGCPPYTVDMDTSCLPWEVVTESPQTTPFDGCSESGCARIWGNQVVGESFGQDVTFSQGYTYRISFCAKFWDGDTTKPIQNTQVFFTALMSNTHSDPRTCSNCETMATSMVLTNDSIWETFCVDWTPEHDYKFFSIHNENSSDSLHGDSTSWALIDDVCITLIDSTTQTNELKNSSSDFNIYPNPSSNSFILESKNEIYEPVYVFIYDFSGRKVKELSFDRLNKISIINMEDKPSGVYFLQVANDSKVYFHTKIIKID
ncbi:MAG TPA: T9SS type A sorting domain-containing protein [Bacteroidetes bacterium]|nr:T9SS type A sorting domain-containing protein [Bacteroidota bacterium]